MEKRNQLKSKLWDEAFVLAVMILRSHYIYMISRFSNIIHYRTLWDATVGLFHHQLNTCCRCCIWQVGLAIL